MPLLYSVDMQETFLTPPSCKSQMQGFENLSVSYEHRFRAHCFINMLIKNIMPCDDYVLLFSTAEPLHSGYIPAFLH